VILYTNGCSFTWGDELNNRKDRYGVLLSKKLNCKHMVDHSHCASSNQRILRTTLSYLQDKNLEDYIVVIGWSGISRREYFLNKSWTKITPTMIGDDVTATTYYSNIQSSVQDNLDFYYQVLLLQMWLEKRNAKYFMFRIDDGNVKMKLRDGSYRTDEYSVNTLKDINLNTFPSFNNDKLTFREYALSNGGAMKKRLHPDEKSHKIFMEHIYENLC
jgi:hypothetical protein